MQKDLSKKQNKNRCSNSTSSNAVYGLGFVGALIYYFQHAETFWTVILGILKAALWPAFVVHKLLEFLKM